MLSNSRQVLTSSEADQMIGCSVVCNKSSPTCITFAETINLPERRIFDLSNDF